MKMSKKLTSLKVNVYSILIVTFLIVSVGSGSEISVVKKSSIGKDKQIHNHANERISIIKIQHNQAGFRKIVRKLHLDIERGSTDYVYCYATQDQLDALTGNGIIYEMEFLDYRDETAWIHDLTNLGEYHTPDEMAFILDSIAKLRQRARARAL